MSSRTGDRCQARTTRARARPCQSPTSTPSPTPSTDTLPSSVHDTLRRAPLGEVYRVQFFGDRMMPDPNDIQAGSIVLRDPALHRFVRNLASSSLQGEVRPVKPESPPIGDGPAPIDPLQWITLTSVDITTFVDPGESGHDGSRGVLDHMEAIGKLVASRWIYAEVSRGPARLTCGTSGSTRTRRDEPEGSRPEPVDSESNVVIIRVYFPNRTNSIDPIRGKAKAAWSHILSLLVREWKWEELYQVEGVGRESSSRETSARGGRMSWDLEKVFGNRDTRTLSYLYQNLPSPTLPTKADIARLPDADSRHLVRKLVGIAQKREPGARIAVRMHEGRGESVSSRCDETASGYTGKGKGRQTDEYIPEPSELPPTVQERDRTLGRGRDAIEIDWDECGLRGMKSRLYGYQLRSLIRMIMQERAPARYFDPRFIIAKAANTYLPKVAPLEDGSADVKNSSSSRSSEGRRPEEYYIDLGSGEAKWKNKGHDLPRGGILCEEMGTGKTIMSLALILATKDALPHGDKPAGSTETMSVDTLERLPYPKYQKLRERKDFHLPESWIPMRRPQGIPSLAQLCVHRFIMNPTLSSAESLHKNPRVLDLGEVSRSTGASTGWDDVHRARAKVAKSNLNCRRADDVMAQSGSRHPFYHLEPDKRLKTRIITRGSYARAEPPPKEPEGFGPKRYLSRATVLVVPVMLLNQWKAELVKHLDIGALDCEIVQEGLPSIARMLEIDVLLITDARLRQEGKALRDHEDDGKLKKIHFKRLLVDEGHTMSAKTGDLLVICRALGCSSNWAITGTPTKTLLGSPHAFDEVNTGGEFGSAELVKVKIEQDAEHSKSDSSESGVMDEDEEHQAVLAASPVKAEVDELLDNETWSKDALADTKKLGTMIGAFLGMHPFATQDSSFAKRVEKYLRPRGGPALGAIERLNTIMAAVMIRNKASDIEAECPLPPNENSTVGLDLPRYAQMTYNVLIALIAINMVESEREGIDYLLDSRNAAALSLTIQNLGLAANWYAAGDTLDIATPRRIAEGIIKSKKMQGYSRQDQKMLKDALRHLNAASDDTVWREISSRVSLPLMLTGLPLDALASASHSPLNDAEPDQLAVVTAEVLLAMRADADKVKPGADATMDDFASHLTKSAVRSKNREVEVIGPVIKKEEDRVMQERTYQNPVKANHALAKSLKGSSEDVHRKIDKMNVAAGVVVDVDEELPVKVKKGTKGKASEVAELGPGVTTTLPQEILDQEIGFSTFSAKVNWIVKEVLANPSDVFVIFSADVGVFAHLYEALSIAQRDSCYVGTGASRIAREEALYLFQAGGEDAPQVCLMDLKLAARGLNLVVANRAIFVEPVWARDVEAQAIKRIHRIGQRRATRTSTMYIRGSHEQVMIERRGAALGGNMIDDVSVKELIAHPQFIERVPEAAEEFRAYLVKRPERVKQPKIETKDEDVNMLADEADAVVAGPLGGQLVQQSDEDFTAVEGSEALDEPASDSFDQDGVEDAEDVKPDISVLEDTRRVRLFGYRDPSPPRARRATASATKRTISFDGAPADLDGTESALTGRSDGSSIEGEEESGPNNSSGGRSDQKVITGRPPRARFPSSNAISPAKHGNDLMIFVPSTKPAVAPKSKRAPAAKDVPRNGKRKAPADDGLYSPPGKGKERKTAKGVRFG